MLDSNILSSSLTCRVMAEPPEWRGGRHSLQGGHAGSILVADSLLSSPGIVTPHGLP